MNDLSNNKVNHLWLDVRNQDEIDSVKMNKNKDILYMPANIIKYNVEFLDKYFNDYETVFIICKSGARSTKIKEKYFEKNDKIRVCSKHFNELDPSTLEQSPDIHLSITRKVQNIAGSVIVLLFSLLLFYPEVKYMYLLFGLVMIYVGLSGNCFMSPILSKNDI